MVYLLNYNEYNLPKSITIVKTIQARVATALTLQLKMIPHSKARQGMMVKLEYVKFSSWTMELQNMNSTSKFEIS